MSGELPSRLRVPGAVRWIVRTLEEEGYETWTVGGAVRDALAGRRGGDWDLTTRAHPGRIRRIFRRTVPIGIEHGTVGILARDGTLYEVTTFRRDVETTGRHAVVEFADRVEDDLARRDFTVNAVAWHPIREELLDPFGGLDDLRSGVLRTVGDPVARFAEDYLRILRGMRFAGDFGLRIEEETWRALAASTDRLPRLSVERIREELWKVLSQASRPSRALSLYAASGALAEVYPELEGTVGAADPGSGDEDVWATSLLTADLLARHRPHVRLAALLHGIGDRGVAGLLSRLRFSNREVERVARLAAGGLQPPDPGLEEAELRRWLSDHDPSTLPDRVRLWVARERLSLLRGETETGRTVEAWRRLREVLRSDPPLTVDDLALDGRDLIRMGLRPGPRFGEILEELLERVLEDPALNRKDRLESRVEEMGGGVPDERRGERADDEIADETDGDPHGG